MPFPISSPISSSGRSTNSPPHRTLTRCPSSSLISPISLASSHLEHLSVTSSSSTSSSLDGAFSGLEDGPHSSSEALNAVLARNPVRSSFLPRSVKSKKTGSSCESLPSGPVMRAEAVSSSQSISLHADEAIRRSPGAEDILERLCNFAKEFTRCYREYPFGASDALESYCPAVLVHPWYRIDGGFVHYFVVSTLVPMMFDLEGRLEWACATRHMEIFSPTILFRSDLTSIDSTHQIFEALADILPDRLAYEDFGKLRNEDTPYMGRGHIPSPVLWSHRQIRTFGKVVLRELALRSRRRSSTVSRGSFSSTSTRSSTLPQHLRRESSIVQEDFDRVLKDLSPSPLSLTTSPGSRIILDDGETFLVKEENDEFCKFLSREELQARVEPWSFPHSEGETAISATQVSEETLREAPDAPEEAGADDTQNNEWETLEATEISEPSINKPPQLLPRRNSKSKRLPHRQRSMGKNFQPKLIRGNSAQTNVNVAPSSPSVPAPPPTSPLGTTSSPMEINLPTTFDTPTMPLSSGETLCPTLFERTEFHHSPLARTLISSHDGPAAPKRRVKFANAPSPSSKPTPQEPTLVGTFGEPVENPKLAQHIATPMPILPRPHYHHQPEDMRRRAIMQRQTTLGIGLPNASHPVPSRTQPTPWHQIDPLARPARPFRPTVRVTGFHVEGQDDTAGESSSSSLETRACQTNFQWSLMGFHRQIEHLFTSDRNVMV